MITDKLSKLDLKNKIIISMLFTIILLFCITYYITLPAIADIKKMDMEIEKQRIDLEKKYIKGQNLNKLTRNLKKIEPKLENLDNIFINQNRALEFITTLENVAADNNIDQKINLMIENSAPMNDYIKTPLLVNSNGNFSTIMDYLSDLEKLSYYINIKSLSVSRTKNATINPANKNFTSSLNLIIDSSTYWK